MMGADRLPAMGDRIPTLTGEHGLRIMKTVVDADEGIATRIEADDRLVYRKYGVVIPPLTVFGLVIDGAADDLDLAGGEIPLEVRLVVLRIPETEFDEAEEVNAFGRNTLISQRDAVDLTGIADRHEGLEGRFELLFLCTDHRISETVMAFVCIEWRLGRLPARVPDAVPILDIVVATALIERTVVITIPGDAEELRILVEGVSAGRVGDQAEEIVRS